MSIYKNKKKKKRFPLPLIVAPIIIMIVSGYTYSMRSDLKKQAEYAVQQNAEVISNEIASSIGFAKSSIQLTSQSATQNMTGEVIEDVNSILDPLLENTPFNFIEYILADGWNTMNDGGEPFDASDREYYKQGIRGKTGIWVNFTPKKSQEVLLNFYTPLYYENRIVGVFTGTLGGDTNIKPLLGSTFFGEELVGFLCDGEGKIIASTHDAFKKNETLYGFLTEVLGGSDFIYKEFKEHKTDEVRTAFAFEEQAGNAIGCVCRVKDTDWYVVQIVPAKSLSRIMNTSTEKSVLAIGSVMLFFIIYLFYVAWQLRKEKEQESAEYLGIIEVLGNEYESVYLVDTQSGLAAPYRLSNVMRRDYGTAFDKGLLWEEGIADYTDRFVKEDYKEEFVQVCSLENLLQRLKEEGDYFSYEYANERDGLQRIYRMTATLLPDSIRQRIVLGFADITEEREKELATQQALHEALEYARSASEAKSSFLFNMSHDIRTPMNAILGFTDRLEKYREDEAQFHHCVEKIKVSGEYLLSLINNVLDLARIESGKASLDDDDFCDIEKFCDNLITVFSEEVDKKHLHVSSNLKITHCYAFVDATKLEQIFVNIVSNAVKYTPDGGKITVSMEELPSGREGYHCYQTVIEDTGIGISEEFLPHIFDEFTREHSTTESRIAGTGLGMGITKKMVDLMGGTIQVESKLGAGTRVTVVLCHKEASPEELIPSTDVKNMGREEAVLSGKRILLAEDNKLNVEIARAILEEVGCEVEHATDGIDCVNKLEHRESGYYDVILMDIQMPNMNGYKATSIIRKLEDRQKADIPIIAMTANAFEENKKAAMDAGMNGFVTKPIEIKKFLATLMKILQREGE